MVAVIVHRKTREHAFGPYSTVSSALGAFTRRNLSLSDFCIEDKDWRAREAARDNLVDLSPFGLENIPDHFLHISKKNNEDDTTLVVSFTLNEEKGRQNRQESGRRIGRYLKEFYPHLSDDEITYLSGQINARYNGQQVLIARTREEIRRVYEQSRNHCPSCMTYNIGNYSGYNSNQDVMPVEAYAGPDLAVAYMLDKHGNVTARTVCWPEKNLHSRVYSGDTQKFKSILKAMGWSEGSLKGARMTPIHIGEYGNRNYYAMPYVDSDNQYVSFDGDYFYIGEGYAERCYLTGTGGFVEVRQYRCVLTGKTHFSSSAVTEILNGRGNILYVGRDVLDTEEYTSRVKSFGAREYWMDGPEHDYLAANDGTRIPVGEVGRSYMACAHDGKYYPAHELIEGVHFKNYLDHYTRCEITGKLIRKTNAYHMEHGAWWSISAFREHGRMGDDGLYYSKFHDQLVQEAA